MQWRLFVQCPECRQYLREEPAEPARQDQYFVIAHRCLIGGTPTEVESCWVDDPLSLALVPEDDGSPLPPSALAEAMFGDDEPGVEPF